jgi:hypothetical protein
VAEDDETVCATCGRQPAVISTWWG